MPMMMPTPARRALVIGAGPSGLVAAKYLLTSPHSSSSRSHPRYSSVTVLESSHTIGGTFSSKVYDGTRLVSSKYVTAFSDFRMGDGDYRRAGEEGEGVGGCFPDHPTAEQYVTYLRRYCDRFDLWPHIKFRCEVVSVADAAAAAADDSVEGDNAKEERWVDANGYTVQYRDHSQEGGASGTHDDNTVHTEHYDAVLICSGLHNVPTIPLIPNLSPSTFRGTFLHSSSYKSPTIFTNKRVLILGSGETAMDVAHRAILNPESKSVALNVRRGLLSIPHTLPGNRPLDVFITNLFEHSYEHPWVHAAGLRWILSTVIIRLFLFLTGSSLGFNQWACNIDPVKRGYHIINKSHGAMGHLNVPIKRRTAWGRFWLWLYGEEKLRPIESFHGTAVECIEDDGATVRFEDGRTYEADVIVMATGYTQSFPFLDGKIRDEMREQSSTCCGSGRHDSRRGQKGQKDQGYALEEECLPSEHFIVSRARPRLGFIGFVRPNVGAIPPMAELQVMWWLCNLQGTVKRLEQHPNPPSRPPSYMVLGRKYSYGVDYGNYMHRVAEDIGAAPTLTCLAQSSQPCRALYTYCQGQAHAPLFRLQGPYASKVCWGVVTDELWRACIDRGLLENIGLAMVTLLSLWMNVGACLLECLWGLVSLRRPRFFARY